jgi:hypothetical protein
MAACGGDGGRGEASSAATDSDGDNAAEGAVPIQWEQIPWESGLTVSETSWENREAVVPPQCYTKTEETFNPCYTCHQTYPGRDRPNYMDDGFLQGEYAFSDYAMTNHWKNLFVDRSAAVAAMSDAAIRSYVGHNNYTPLRQRLGDNAEYTGWVPDLEGLHKAGAAFDEQGFARDGSGWVAFNYKPLPSTFWPTNGSTDDVMVRLPEAFQRAQKCSTADGELSRQVYLANLSILEMAIKDLDAISVPALEEAVVCADLNNDGDQADTVTRIEGRPQTYVGQAAGVSVHAMLYPEGTEFLHSVRYLGVDDAGGIFTPPRMKEVRYMRKIRFYDKAQLRTLYGNEHQEKIDGNLPTFTDTGHGLDNGFGWLVLGFIEDADGRLRQQTREEHVFCMGCHGTVGTTIDQTFAFPRKVTGEAGWGYIDLADMADAPNVGEDQGEIRRYLERVGGGSEFRENPEMQATWFDDQGVLLADKVTSADVAELITPSAKRALRLNKAYRLIVKNQTFVYGRDATVAPVTNVYEEVPGDAAPLPEERRFPYDIRLDWSSAAAP